MANNLEPMLIALQKRLNKAYTLPTGGDPPIKQLPLNSQTLSTTDGSEIIALIGEHLHIDCNTDAIILQGDAIAITADTDHNTLTVSNCVSLTPLLGVVVAEVTAVFGVKGNKLTITMTFGDDLSWDIYDSFPVLGNQYFGDLNFSDETGKIVQFTLSSLSFTVGNQALDAGLNLNGYLYLEDSPVVTLTSLITGIQPPLPVAGPVQNNDPSGESIELTGCVPDFRLPLSILPGLSFNNPALVLTGLYKNTRDEQYLLMYFQVQSDVTIAGTSMPLAVRLPGNLKGWQILLIPGRSVPVGNIATFLAAFLGMNLAALLPDAVAKLNCFELRSFNLALTNDLNSFERIQLSVVTVPSQKGASVWTIIPGVIELTDLEVSLKAVKRSPVTYSGKVSGGFMLGRALHIVTTILLPIGKGKWIFRARADKPFGLSDLAQLLGGKSLANMLPAGLGQIAFFNLRELRVEYDPGIHTLTSFNLSVDNANPWHIIKGHLEINDIFLRLEVKNPLASSAAIVGSVSGTINLHRKEKGNDKDFDVSVRVTVSKVAAGSPWLLNVNSESIPLPSIGALAKLAGLSNTEITDLIPSSLQTATFDLSDLKIDVDLSVPQLNQLNFMLAANLDWTIVKGITVKSVNVIMRMSRLSGELYSSVHIYGECDIVSIPVSISASRSAEGDWTFRGELTPGETVDLAAMVKQLLNIESKLPLSLEVEGVAITLETNNSTHVTTYSIEGQTAGYWTYEVTSFLTLKMQAAVYFEYKSNGEKRGTLTGDFFINNLKIAVTYEFDPKSRTLIFSIIYKHLSLMASLKSGIDKEKKEYSTLTFRMGDLSFGEILEYLVNLAAPGLDFKLSSPWDALNQINFKDLALVVDLKNRKVTVSYDQDVNLGFIHIKSIGFCYEKVNGNSSIKLSFSGRFFDQEYSIADNNPLEWDVVNEDPPPVPAEGPRLLDLRYVGLGQHVSLSDTTRLNRVGDVISALREQMKPPQEAGQHPLTQAGGTRMRFDSGSHILFGVDFTVLRTVTLSAIFNDPYLYGMLIALAGERSGSFSGLSFELLYKRVTDDIGVFKIVLQVPEAFRQLEFGEVSVTLPIIKVDIYTNGNFKVDLGFPHGGNFADSFCVQVFPFIGHGGFYFAVLTGATSERVPKVINGRFNPVLELGFGLNVGVGKDINRGVLSAGASITVEAILEGVLAWFTPNSDSGHKALYYWLHGTAGIVAKVYGSVDFKVIKVSVSVEAKATVTFTIEAYEPIIVEMSASIEAKASIKVLFVKVHFSFKMKIDLGFEIGSKKPTPWILGSPAHNAPVTRKFRSMVALSKEGEYTPLEVLEALSTDSIGGRSRKLKWKPVRVFDDFRQINVSLIPSFTVSKGQLKVVMLMFVESSTPADAIEFETIEHNGKEVPFNELLKGMLLWSISTYLGRPTGNVTRKDLEHLLEELETEEAAQTGFSYENLSRFFELNYRFNVNGIPDNYSEEIALSGVVFPIIPDLEMTPQKGDAVSFKTYNTVSQQYEENIAAYFKQMKVDHSANRASDPDKMLKEQKQRFESNFDIARTQGEADSVNGGKGLGEGTQDSIAMMMFRDACLMLAKLAVQAGKDVLDKYIYQPAPNESLQQIVEKTKDGQLLFPPVNLHYKIKAGDSIASICREFDMTASRLQALNNDNLHDPLELGRTIQVELAVSASGIVKANSGIQLRKDKKVTLTGLNYTVKAGEDLTDIQGRFNLKDTNKLFTTDLANGRDGQLLLPGSLLIIATPIEKGDAINSDYSYFIYTSVSGDNLDSIAEYVYLRNSGPLTDENHKMMLAWYEQTIVDFNPGKELRGVITTGTQIYIPGVYNDSHKAGKVTYSTRKGDTLAYVAGYYMIGQNMPTELDELKTGLQSLNNVDWSALPVGTRIKVPLQQYIVRAGDTINDIGERFNVNVTDLTAKDSPNAKNIKLLSALAVLELPEVDHKIGNAETFASLAANYDITLTQLGENIARVPKIFPDPMDKGLYILFVPQYDIGNLAEKVVSQSLANQAASMLSRFMLHGLRLPLPSDSTFTGLTQQKVLDGAAATVDLYGLYELSGQQLACPDEQSLPYNITFNSANSPGWLKFTNAMFTSKVEQGHDLIKRFPDIASLNPWVDFSGEVNKGVLLITGYRSDDVVISLTTDLANGEKPSSVFDIDPELVIVSGKKNPRHMHMYRETPVKYALQRMIHWQATETLDYAGVASSSAHPANGMPGIWMFGGTMLSKIASLASGTTDFELQIHSNLGNSGDKLPPVSLYNWACLIEIRLKPIESSTQHGAVLSNSYTLVGADQENRDRLLDLWTYLDNQKNNENGTEIHILYQPNADNNNARGLASQSVNEKSTFLLQSNVSTLTASSAPPDRNDIDTIDSHPEPPKSKNKHSALISNQKDFLRLLWEGCVTHSGGYTLNYSTLDGGRGLPNQVFAAGSEGILQLLVVLGSHKRSVDPNRKLYAFNNCAVIGDNLDPASESPVAEITPVEQNEKIKMAVVPPGNIGFDLMRKNPEYESLPTDDLKKEKLRTCMLYSLLGFKLIEKGGFKSSYHGLPVGPMENKDNKNLWDFHQVLAVAPLADAHNLPNCPLLPLPLKDPYAGIGRNTELTLGLDFFDVYGNTTPPTTPLKNLNIPYGYTDNIIALGQWPGITSYFHIDSNQTTLSVKAWIQVSNYVQTPGNNLDNALHTTSAHLTRYKNIYYQVWQPDVEVSLTTSLNQTGDNAPHEYKINKVPLANFVTAAYVFLYTCIAMKPHPLTRNISQNETFYSVASAESTDINAVSRDIVALGESNQDTVTQKLFNSEVNLPLYYNVIYGDTLEQIVKDQGVTVVQLAEQMGNQQLSMNCGTTITAPTRQVTITGGETIAGLAASLSCTAGNLGTANAATRSILTENTKLTVKEASVSVQLIRDTTETESFNDLVARFGDLNQVVTPADIAVANREVTDIFREDAAQAIVVTDYVIQEGDSFLQLAGTYPEFTIAALAEAAKSSPNLFPSGTPLYLKIKETLPLSSDITMSGLCKTYGCNISQLALANSKNTLVEGNPLNLPGKISIEADADRAFVPYNATAQLSIKQIADIFGESNATAFAQRNQALRYMFNGGITIAVGATASTITMVEDSMETLLKRLQTQDSRVTFDQLLTAIEADTSLVSKGALFICKLPSTGNGGSLTDLADVFNNNANAIAQANAALADFIAPDIDITLSDNSGTARTITTQQGDSFSTITQRFFDRYELPVTVAELADELKDTTGLISAGNRFLLPPAPLTLCAEMGTDYPTNPNFPGTIFKVLTQINIKRKANRIHPDFADVEKVKTASSTIAPTAQTDGMGYNLALTNFAVAFEKTFPKVKLATGKSEPGNQETNSGAQQLWAVNFGTTGIESVEIDGANPSFYAIKPLSNHLKNRTNIPIRPFKRKKGLLLGSYTPLNFQSIDMEVWADIFLGGVESILKPEYAVAVFELNSKAFNKIVDAKKKLAERIASGVANVLDQHHPEAKLRDAQGRVKQALMRDLVTGYGTDAVIQYPVTVNSPFNASVLIAPKLSGQPVCTVYYCGKKDNFGTIATRFSVSEVSVATLLADVKKILQPGINVVFKKTVFYQIKESDTVASLMRKVKAKDYQDLVDNLKTPNGLFIQSSPINIYNIRTNSGATAINQKNTKTTFESWTLYFNASLESIVLANQERSGVFKEGVSVEIGNSSQTVEDTNNSLVLMSRALGVTPEDLAFDLWSEEDILESSFELNLLQLVPEFTLSTAKLSMSNDPTTMNLLLNIKSEAHRKKLFLDLNYKVNEMEDDIQEIADTGGYSASHWLSFIIPIDSTKGGNPVFSSHLGQVEIPIPLRAYPSNPTLVEQTGTPLNEKPYDISKAKKWTYSSQFQHHSAQQDDIYFTAIFNQAEKLIFNQAEKPKNETSFAAQSDFFSKLAQFITAYPGMKSNLNQLFSPSRDEKVLTHTLDTFAQLVKNVADAWGYPDENFEQTGSGSTSLTIGDQFDYQLGFTVKKGAELDSYFLNKLKLKLVAESPGQFPENPSPTGEFPNVFCSNVMGGKEKPKHKTESESEAVYSYKAGKIKAFVPIRYQLLFPRLDIIAVQNAKTGVRVIRNQHLVSTGTTANYFKYSTPIVLSNNLMTPFIFHGSIIPFDDSGKTLKKALTDLFDEILGKNATDFYIKVAVQFGYELVASDSKEVDPIISLLPILFHPAKKFYKKLPSEMADYIYNWEKPKKFIKGKGHYVVDIIIYSSLKHTSKVPLLELKVIIDNE